MAANAKRDAASAANDYVAEPLGWKARKVLRYTRLYGPSKTLAKVRSQYHMARGASPNDATRFDNARCVDPNHPHRTVAIIGSGKFAYSVIAYYLKRAEARFLRATVDRDLYRAASLCRAYGGAYATTSVDELLDDDAIDLVFIASNHATHAPYAVKCLEAGKAVHIEKPHAVTLGQLAALEEAMRRRPDLPVFLGFNRPKSSHVAAVMAAARLERGPSMVSWFIGGHEIPDGHWYFAPEEGGRVLGNLCHWLDLSLHLVGQEAMLPCVLVPGSEPGSRSDFSLTIQCADRSLVALSFSAKGHSFEGVREVLNFHRGSSLVLMRDFEETRIQAGASRRVHRTLYRDHGHGANIWNSFARGVVRSRGAGEQLGYVRASGMLALRAREALDTGKATVVASD